MTIYHIPAKTVGTRQRRHGDNTWQSFITSRAVTYGDGDVHLNSDDLIFWIPDFEYWMVRFNRKDVEVT